MALVEIVDSSRCCPEREDENSSSTLDSSPDASFRIYASPDRSPPDGHLIASDTSDSDQVHGITIISAGEQLSSSHVTTPSLGISSLRYSAICSSISSMFDQVLDRSSTCISEEGKFDDISLLSDGDLLIVSNVTEGNQAVVPEEIALEPGVNRHDFSTLIFEKVGQHLLEDTNSVVSIRGEDEWQQGNDWPDFTDEEWDCFVHAANHILPVLDPSSSFSNTLKAPPSPPTRSEDQIQNQSCKVIASEFLQFLPGEFICSLCDLPIAGSTTLDCGCNKSFCVSCIEKHTEKYARFVEKRDNESLSSQRQSICPLCSSSCDHTPCHALDVAILEKIMELERYAINRNPTDDKNIKVFQAYFYARLLLWRREVNRRNANKDHCQQLLLANYARYEKEVLRQCEMKKDRKKWYQRAEGLVFISAACLFVGVRTLLRSR
jgi:hypothetical protein